VEYLAPADKRRQMGIKLRRNRSCEGFKRQHRARYSSADSPQGDIAGLDFGIARGHAENDLEELKNLEKHY